MKVGRMRRFFGALLTISLLSQSVRGEPLDVNQVVKLEAAPAQVRLSGKDARQQVLITAFLKDGRQRDVTHEVAYRSGDAKLATVSDVGIIKPAGHGATSIEVSLGSHKVAIAADINHGDQYRPLDFTTDIMPILTRHGCNGGGCHGKSGGRGGFQLSLFGYNPAADYDSIVKQTRGRRIFPESPEQSLLVRKPSGAMAHQGGLKLPQDGEAYQRLTRWIATGTPWGDKAPPTLLGITATPGTCNLGAKANQQILVTAKYSDGSTRDVTPLTDFLSNDTAIATVDEKGMVTTGERIGETAVACKYEGQIAIARVQVPLVKPDDPSRWPSLPPGNFIDKLVMAKLKELNVPPSPLVDDAGFLRRASLQLAGKIPSPEEVQAFLDDADPDRRTKMIDRLLESGDHADLFAQKWASVLRNKLRSQKTRVPGTIAFHRWIRNAILDNMPYDQFVREIITATGSPTMNPPAQWYAEVRYLDRYVDDTAQVFLGLRIGCARCHNHPSEKYTQEDYFGLAAFFARVDRKGGQGLKTERAADETIFIKAAGTVKHPVTEKVVLPHGLGGPELKIAPYDDPRSYLVDWMSQKDNPYFAKAFVNRMWSHFFGRGLVEPLDDLRASNPAVNEPLLDSLAQEFVKSRFDMRHLVRLMVNSNTYQLSATPTEDNLQDAYAHSRFYPQRLSAEVLYDAINIATKSAPPKFSDMPQGARAVQLPHEEYLDPLLELFGRPKRESACECERAAEPNMGQSIYFMNNPTFQNRVRTVGQLAKDKRSHDEKVKFVFLSALSRLPTEREMSDAMEFLQSGDDVAAIYADLMWALLNTKEFLYIH